MSELIHHTHLLRVVNPNSDAFFCCRCSCYNNGGPPKALKHPCAGTVSKDKLHLHKLLLSGCTPVQNKHTNRRKQGTPGRKGRNKRNKHLPMQDFSAQWEHLKATNQICSSTQVAPRPSDSHASTEIGIKDDVAPTVAKVKYTAPKARPFKTKPRGKCLTLKQIQAKKTNSLSLLSQKPPSTTLEVEPQAAPSQQLTIPRFRCMARLFRP